jgi:RNA polymerase sigma-70 factor (ECF subfamily)
MNDDSKANSTTTERLVEAATDGDRTAFDQLVRLYQQRAMQVAVGMLGDVNDAAEAVQAAFVRAFLSIGKLREPKSFESWLLRIAANTAINHRRAAGRRAEIHSARSSPIQAGHQSDPEQAVAAKELKETIRQAMSKLSKNETMAITLFGLQDLPQIKVAEIMGCSTEAVRWHVFRARRKLKVLLREYL